VVAVGDVLGNRIDNALAKAGEAGDELRRRARLEAAAHAPLLVDDGVDLPGLRVHHDDRPGVVAERGDGDAAHLRVFARRIVAQDVVLDFVTQPLVERALSRNRREPRLPRQFRAPRGLGPTPALLCLAPRLRQTLAL
jgi:hypothetical protein